MYGHACALSAPPVSHHGACVQARALGQENAQLRAYVARLEKDQRAVAMDLVGWQTRWKTTATNNVKLYQQLVHVEQRHSSAMDMVST